MTSDPYSPRTSFDQKLKHIKTLAKELRLISCEVLRHDGHSAIEIGEAMGLSPRQVHYQWKLARRRGYYDVPTDVLEEMARAQAGNYDRAVIEARDLIHKVNLDKIAVRAGYTTKS